MNRAEIKLIVCDIEGCLLPANRAAADPQKFVPLAEYCTAARANLALPPLVFCTGRQLPYAEALAQMINGFFPGFPSIAENGAFLYDIAKNELFRHPLLTADVMDNLVAVKRAVDGLILKTRAVKEPGKEVCLSLNPAAGDTVEKLFAETVEYLAEFRDILEITHSKSAVDITPQGVSKRSALEFLAQHTGIDPAAMLGIGDSRGDFEWLGAVGFPAAPGNASADIKGIAKFVAGQPEIDGVVEILRHFSLYR